MIETPKIPSAEKLEVCSKDTKSETVVGTLRERGSGGEVDRERRSGNRSGSESATGGAGLEVEG